MTVVKLRDYPTDEELARLYAVPHDHRRYPADHDIRVRQTIEVGRWLAKHHRPVKSIADLSCGNAAIANGIAQADTTLYLGDYAPGYEFTGPIEQTLDQLPQVDMLICSETIEHLRAPQDVLEQIWGKARSLVLSTPIGETDGTGNPEHVWGWEVGDIREMLGHVGWTVKILTRLELPDYVYDFQIWGCLR